MNDDIYVGKPPKAQRGCGCLVVGALLLTVAIVSLVVYLRRDKEPVPTEGDNGNSPTLVDSGTSDSPAGDAPDLGLEWLSEARQAFADNRIHDARKLGFKVLSDSRDAKALSGARTLLGEVHTKMVFEKIPMKEKQEHIIRSGESLALLANKYDTTIGLIQRSNNLPNSMIRIGDRLLILQGSFYIEVDKSDNVMLVYLNDRFFKRYRVGTGAYASTPTGDYKVTGRIKHPDWWKDGKKIPYGHPDNLLGTHWLSLDKRGYGIHGTWDDDTIGHQASAGCVRMLNAEVEELFTLIPVGTPVKITD